MSIIKKVLKWFKHIYWSLYYWLHSSKDSNGVEYIFKKRKSDRIVIVFNSMAGKYNFIRALKRIKVNQLFIHDCWADNASYYWFEGKEDYPERFTQALIDRVLSKKSYREVITLGGSKGGTAAIYYGLNINANIVFAGACQYKVGDYLSRHQYVNRPEQWERVVGGIPTKEWIDILDRKLEKMIKAHKNSSTVIKLIYSKYEHTYPEHIVHLIEQLDKCNIKHEDLAESFTEHSMNGIYVKQAVKEYFNAGKH